MLIKPQKNRLDQSARMVSNMSTRHKLKQLAITTLAVFLLLTPVYPALAADPEPSASDAPKTTQDAQDQVPVTDDQSSSAGTSSDDQAKEEKPKGEDPPPQTLSGEGDEASFSHLTSTTIKRVPETDTASGALNYAYPITVPPGRNGLQPDLKIQYNSQAADINGIFGAGWNTNIPYIERANKTGAEKLYTDNYFTSSLDGDLVLVSGSNYRAKVENGNFFDYSISSNVWMVKDKRGTVYKFGIAAASRQDNPSDSTKVFKWMLEEVRDTNNNYIKYEYYKDAGEIYPSKIKYTGNNTTDGPFEVEFLRESRSDTPVSYKSGFAATTNSRIYQVLAKVSGTWVRKYELAYTTQDNASNSVLQTLKETGQDEATSTTVVLPQNQYVYGTSTKTWTQQSANWVLPNDLFFNRYYNGRDKGLRLVDVNGDGRQDLFFSRLETDEQRIYLNNGSGWTLDTNWTIPNIYYYQDNERDTGAEIADVNGDSLPDLLISYYDGSSNDQRVYLNNGTNGWTLQTTNWAIPGIYFAQANNTDPGGRIADVNGDGLPDLLISHYIPTGSPPTVDQRVYLNNGTGWTQNTSWVFPSDLHISNYYNSKDQGTRLTDLNGDGLLDAITHLQEDPTTFKKKVYLNTGSGWVTDTTVWTLPTDVVFADWNGFDKGWRVTDINADGFPDLVKALYESGAITKKIYLNNGENGWADVTSSWTFPDVNFSRFSGGWDQGVRFSDINGDGVDDIVVSQHENGGAHDQRVFLHNGAKPNLITTLTYSTGGSTSVTYKTSPQYVSGSTLLNPSLPINLMTVESISHNSNFGATATYTYTYEGGKYYFASSTDRKLAGFHKVIRVDSAGNKTVTYFHQGDSTNSSQGEYSDHASKIGKPYRIEQLDSSGNKYAVTINKWDKYNQGTGRDFVKLVQSIDFTYDGDTDHKDKATTLDYDNSTGNLLYKYEWGEVTGSDDGTFTDVGSDKFTTEILYAANATAYIYLPKTETVIDQSSNKVRESKYYYDTQNHGTVNVGNLTKKEDWKTGTTYISNQKTYNTTYGTVTSDTDPRGKVTSYTYDSYNLYPATVSQPHSLSTSYTYDYSSGKVKQTTDPNSLVFQTIYDGLDRVVEEKQPDLTTPSTLVTKAAYAYTDTSGAVKVLKTDYLDGSTTVDTYTYFDGFNRPIQTRREMEDSNTFAVTDTIYNNVEQVHKESLPYSSTGTGRTSATTTTDLLTTYSYDPLLRVTSIQNAAGTVTNAYDDWKTVVTDARSKAKNLYKDAYGQLVKVEELNSGNTYTTIYTYNGNGNLINITDALSNVRGFTYDGLGRRLTAQDLHASADSTFGTWSYTYDDSGNLTQSVDPKSQTVNYTYDDINRQLTEDYTGASGTEITYAYDSCTYGKPRLCTVTKSDGVNTTYAYNSLGQVKQEVKTIDSTNYQTDYTHDRQSNVLEITNPDSSKVKYTYNTAGLLETIQRKENGDGSYSNVVTDFDYGAHGKQTYQANQNGTNTTNTYDATKLYRLQRKLTTGPGMGGSMFWEEFEMIKTIQPASSNPYLHIFTADTELVGTEAVLETSTDYLAANLASTQPDGSVLLNSPEEQTKERTVNTKTYLLGFNKDGEKVQKSTVYQRSVHYKDLATGEWKGIDTTLIPTSTGWSMDKAAYAASFKNQFGDNFAGFRNKRHWIYLSPVTKNSNPKSPTANLSTVSYKDALGNGLDVEVTTAGHGLRTEVIIQSKTALGNLKNQTNYEIPFKLTSNFDLELKSENGEVLTTTSPITTTGTVNLTDSIGTTSYIWGARAYQSIQAANRSIPIQIKYEKKTDGIYLTKLVPIAWLESASYPVRIDPTVSYYSNASGDGEIYNGGSGTWSTIHDVTTGTADAASDTAYAYTEHDGTDFWMARVALPFDTSGLPDNATISGATLKVYVAAKSDGDNDGSDLLRVVQTTTASSTALADTDFNDIGSVNNPTAGATDTDITGVSTGGYLNISLNSTGRGWVNLTGYTKLGLREGHDATNTAVTTSTGITGLQVKTADATGTTQDPILEVTYTTGNSAPSAPTSLLAEGQTNPTGVTDTTPEFSAIYNDPDTSDTATYYQLQVSTNSGFTSTTWDSGQTALSPAVNQGQRSQDVSYGGTPLALNGTTYYWRVKYWDNGGLAGAWSSNGQFTMQGSGSTTVNFYANTGGDGEIYNGGSSTWSTVHDATSGTTDAVSDTAYAYTEHNGTDFWMARVALPFDTSSLPDNATITSAKLYVYVDTKSDGDNDGTDTIRVVQNTTASSTALADGDFDQIGTVSNPTAGANDTDITGISTGGYLNIPLNVTGQGWISKTGYTKLGLREGHDATNSAASSGTGITGMRIKTSDATGTSQDPYLEITYTTSSPHPATIQDLNYTYDNNGNILTIVDASGTDAAKTTTYTYDDLNRLLTAVVTNAANGSNTTKTYTYSAIGNISTGDAGTYSYNGHQGSATSNPHAVTSIGSTNYSYDNNGNLTSVTGGLSNTWNYKNQLTQAVLGSVTSTYSYDHNGQRVKLSNGTVTNKYPSKFYSLEGSTQIKHIFAGDQLVATIKGTGAQAAEQYIHTDHLTGSNAVTDNTGGLIELADYHPFGAYRINWQFGSFKEQRKFAGSEYDSDTGLNYMNARYYKGDVGRFVGQDAVFLAVGDNGKVKELTRQELAQILSDPQNLNSYAYGRNNPLAYRDPDGQFSIFAILPQSTQVKIGNALNNASANNRAVDFVTGSKSLAYSLGGIGIAAGGGAAVLYGLGVAGISTLGGACAVVCGQTAEKAQQIAGNSVAQQLASNIKDLAIRGPQKINFSDHALQRMLLERNVSIEQAKNVLQTAKPFDYLHRGILKTGYYDSVTKVFIAEIKGTGNITTVITGAGQRYVDNLIKTIK